MATGGRPRKEAQARKPGKIEARLTAEEDARVEAEVRACGGDRSKWLRKKIFGVGGGDYRRLAPIDIADLSRAVVLIEADLDNHPALPLIRGVVTRHK